MGNFPYLSVSQDGKAYPSQQTAPKQKTTAPIPLGQVRYYYNTHKNSQTLS